MTKRERHGYEKFHAYKIGYDNYKNRRDWLHHHYKDVDEQAYDRGVNDAMLDSLEADENSTYIKSTTD